MFALVPRTFSSRHIYMYIMCAAGPPRPQRNNQYYNVYVKRPIESGVPFSTLGRAPKKGSPVVKSLITRVSFAADRRKCMC